MFSRFMSELWRGFGLYLVLAPYLNWPLAVDNQTALVTGALLMATYYYAKWIVDSRERGL